MSDELDIETVKNLKNQLTSASVQRSGPSYFQIALECLSREMPDLAPADFLEQVKDLPGSTVIVHNNGEWSVLVDDDGCLLGFK